MALIVFMRGVNVGGHKAFKPAELATKLADLDVVNIGAAGTFVARKATSRVALRAAILQHLPFEPEMMLCTVRELREMVERNPFADCPSGKNITPYVTVVAKAMKHPPRLPIESPANGAWQVRVFAIYGRFVLSLHRRRAGRLVYPNEVIEQTFDTPATTRNWRTIQSIGKLI